MAIANIIYSIVNGNRSDYRDEYFNGYVRDLFEISQALSDSAILLAFPFLRYEGFIFLSSSCTICIWTASLLATIDLLAVQSSAQTFIPYAILFIDTSNNAWYNQDYWLTGTPFVSMIANNENCSLNVPYITSKLIKFSKMLENRCVWIIKSICLIYYHRQGSCS